MCYIVFISHSLHWRYIKIALRKYVIMLIIVASATIHSVLKDHFSGSASGQFTSGSVLSVKRQLVD